MVREVATKVYKDEVMVRGAKFEYSPEVFNMYFGIRKNEEMDESMNMYDFANLIAAEWKKTMPLHLLYQQVLATPRICIRKVLAAPRDFYQEMLSVIQKHTMSTKMAMLFTVAKGVKMNLDLLVFDQMTTHFDTKFPKHPIACPFMIYELTVK